MMKKPPKKHNTERKQFPQNLKMLNFTEAFVNQEKLVCFQQ